MHPRICALAAIAVLSVACSVEPEVYSPPPQRATLAPQPPPRRPTMLTVSDPSFNGHIVRDIPPGNPEPWRWVYQKPTVKVRVVSPEKLKYRIDFVLPEVTFKSTGPVTLRFLVNDREVGRERYTSQGEKSWEGPVPSEILKTGQDNQVAAEVDKVWISPNDGARLGLMLSRIGLLP